MQQPEISIHPLIGRLRCIYDLKNKLVNTIRISALLNKLIF